MEATDVGCEGFDRSFDAAVSCQGGGVGVHFEGVVQDGVDLVFEGSGAAVPELIVLKAAV